MKSTIFLFLSMSIVGLYAQDTIKVNSDMPIQAAQKNYNAGLMELKNNNFLAAIELFSNSIAEKQDFDKALCNRAVAYTQLKRYPQALEDINRAIQLNKTNPEAFFNKGMVFFSLHQSDSEIVALDACLALKQDHAEALYYKAVLSFEKKELVYQILRQFYKPIRQRLKTRYVQYYKINFLVDCVSMCECECTCIWQ